MRYGLMIGMMLLASVAQAQTSATPGQAFAFNYVTADLTTYSVTRIERQVDGGAWATVDRGAPRNDAQTPAGSDTYVTPIPALTPGAHSVAFRACNAQGCGDASAAMSFVMVILPPAPGGVRVVPGAH